MRVTRPTRSSTASSSQRSTKLAAKRPAGASCIEPLEGRVLFSASLLVNGDFSLSTTGFTSQYVNGAKGVGSYVVGTNPSVDLDVDGRKYANIAAFETEAGTMMEVDGSPAAKKVVWQETVTVAPGTNYVFSGYDASFFDENGTNTDPSPARFVVYVNGVATAGVFSPVAKAGQWTQFSTAWNDTSSTSAVITIVDLNTVHNGNDFALDDLSFSTTPNLIVNGDFSQGNTGFASQYVYQQSQHGGYAIVTKPTGLKSGFANFGDHTTGAGLMLVANGAIKTTHSVWEENIDVTQGENYVFSAWATSAGQVKGNPSPAKLAIYINGVKLGSTDTLSATVGQWSQFSSIWNASASGNVTIKIVDLNIAVVGNNFALDDLAFAQT